ncbi:MAG: CAP domain-containing protein [Loktanella sp.]|nr:CAP domain-containing protein [Loktanella sp.]
MFRYVALISCTMLAACSTGAPMAPHSTIRTVPADMATQGFAGALRELRLSQGLAGMGQDPNLTRAAQAHADDMAQNNYFSHLAPNGPNGITVEQRIAVAGCRPRLMAENISRGQQSEDDVFAAWAASPAHRANMLGVRFRSFGLGRSGDIWVLKLADSC